MNKMNIPAPFRMALPTPPLPPEVPAPPPPVPPPHSVTAKPQSADMSSDESEMESSDEDGARTENSGRKRARRGAIVGPAIDKDVAHEAVGVKPATLIPKEIPMIKKNPVLKINIAPKATLNEHKDTGTGQELQEPEKDTLDPNKFLLLMN
jgi:U11/U12 small nuclear ribonucleoprotein SNRNP65